MGYEVTAPPITREEHQALLHSLIAHKKGEPFVADEVMRLEKWARSVRFQAWVLDKIVAGEIAARIEEDGSLQFDIVNVEQTVQDLLQREAEGTKPLGAV